MVNYENIFSAVVSKYYNCAKQNGSKASQLLGKAIFYFIAVLNRMGLKLIAHSQNGNMCIAGLWLKPITDFKSACTHKWACIAGMLNRMGIEQEKPPRSKVASFGECLSIQR